MNFILLRFAPICTLAFALAGCAVPGMQMDLRAQGQSWTSAISPVDVRARADVFAVSPETLTQLARQDAARRDAQSVALARARDAAAKTPASSAYLLGPGDSLRITIWNHPELTNPTATANELSGRVINADGAFFYPFIGRVVAAGRTVDQVRDELEKRLARVLREPQIDVSVLQYRSARVLTAGFVRNPGLVPITDIPLRIADLVSAAGGLLPEADLNAATLTRGGLSVTVDLYSLFYRGDMSQNLPVVAGDVLHVPDRRFNKVFVLGEVVRPASVPLPTGRFSLAEALADAGGPNPLSANAGQIYVIRAGDQGRPQIYHLNASAPDALVLADQFDLRARDVVYVDAVNVVRWARVVNNILPTAQFLREAGETLSGSLPR